MISKYLLFLNCIQFFTLVPLTNTSSTFSKGARICRGDGYTLVEAKFGTENHWLCLKTVSIETGLPTLKTMVTQDMDAIMATTEPYCAWPDTHLAGFYSSSTLVSDETAIIVDPEIHDEESHIKGLSLSDVTMAHGFPVEDPDSGTAEGYIGEDKHFYGVLHLRNRTLHADPYGIDNPGRTYGAFENYIPIYLKHPQFYLPRRPGRPRRHQEQPQKNTFKMFGKLNNLPFGIEDAARKPGVARARICELLILADKEFFDKDAYSSLNHVVKRMLHSVAQADIIFRNSDFDEDGIPDNIGFSVKYIIVLTSDETNQRVFGDIVKSRMIDGRNYLMRFARVRRLNDVCLGVAFSGHAFYNRTLGLRTDMERLVAKNISKLQQTAVNLGSKLVFSDIKEHTLYSFTSLGGSVGGAAGGLCDRRAFGRSFNTLALAHATMGEKERVPERIAALTLAHETGHSFGAHHDDNYPNLECKGYLMGSQSSTAENAAHYEFSLCSKRLIATTLSSMSYCLKNEDKPYCGNGIVEQGETCDCGLPSRCNQRDPCCTPRAGSALLVEEGTLHKAGCSVAPKAACHPSQGLCCEQNCRHADLLHSGIDCKSLDLECSCTDSSDCTCGLGGRCLIDETCHAAECSILGIEECQCIHKTLSGTVHDAGMCGICCKLPSDGRCVSAEEAMMAVTGNMTWFPSQWPGEDYVGPNVTLTLCSSSSSSSITKCIQRTIRAWPVGSVCVTKNKVGICSPRGICKLNYKSPRLNRFPTIMANKQMTATYIKAKSSATRWKASALKLLLCFLIYMK